MAKEAGWPVEKDAVQKAESEAENARAGLDAYLKTGDRLPLSPQQLMTAASCYGNAESYVNGELMAVKFRSDQLAEFVNRLASGAVSP
jgi:hypothetical protein